MPASTCWFLDSYSTYTDMIMECPSCFALLTLVIFQAWTLVADIWTAVHLNRQETTQPRSLQQLVVKHPCSHLSNQVQKTELFISSKISHPGLINYSCKLWAQDLATGCWPNEAWNRIKSSFYSERVTNSLVSAKHSLTDMGFWWPMQILILGSKKTAISDISANNSIYNILNLVINYMWQRYIIRAGYLTNISVLNGLHFI